ncbi:L-seryl-tRNA(Sec) selenium transferase [Deferribacter abyssi]|uniref:L-seryl-tRNA(Sec) selenium transferase n=1 Tax=Deferribacter abyssi TaxID=213806 RepID=UPI003C1C9288
MTLFRDIPKKDKLLSLFNDDYAKTILNYAIDQELNNLRKLIAENKIHKIDEQLLIKNIEKRYNELISGSLKRVVNATGIVLHTNLGRAPLSEDFIHNIKDIVSRYSNLEYDLEKGVRGERYHHVVEYLKIITNCEDALVVNNNAAAVFLINNTFNRGKNVIISRGELVEIGGSFRIPEVIANSGAILKEVGTTNKTKISDYENAIDEDTTMIIKIHKSNYAIIGFTDEVPYREIPKIAQKFGLLSYCDLGSGSIIPGIGCNEPTLSEIYNYGYDLVSCSGDKLFGSVQAGIIIGKKKLIEKLKKNQLLRMLRVDKITLSLLQETLKAYLTNNYNKVKSVNLLGTPLSDLLKKAKKLKRILNRHLSDHFDFEIREIISYTGGGSCPMHEIKSYAVICKSKKIDMNKIENFLRKYHIPIIVRLLDNKVILDVRTIFEDEFVLIKDALVWATNQLS